MEATSLVLKFCGLGLVVCAGGLWASAGIDLRPKNRDEQTLIGGALWTQTLIPIGLMISAMVDDTLDAFVHSYYLFAGCLLLGSTGLLLVIGEGQKLKKRRRPRRSTLILNTVPPQLHKSFDKTYFVIGVLTLVASMFVLIDLILTVCKNM